MKTKFLQNKNKENQRFFSSNFFPKNQKADVPVMVLVIGVVAICALAIASFIGVEYKAEKDLGIELFEEIYADVEKFYFYSNADFSKEESAEKINAEIKGNQLIINRSNNLISIKYIKNLNNYKLESFIN